MAEIEKGTPLFRLNAAAGTGPNAEVFAGDVADACNLAAESAFISDLKSKSSVRPGERMTMKSADIRKLISAAQGTNVGGNVVSVSGPTHDDAVLPEGVEPAFDTLQPTTKRTVPATSIPESTAPGTLKQSQIPKSK